MNSRGIELDTIEINWSAITYYVIGLFALSGFFRGWWKEAITAFFLGILVFLLRTPDVALTIHSADQNLYANLLLTIGVRQP